MEIEEVVKIKEQINKNLRNHQTILDLLTKLNKLTATQSILQVTLNYWFSLLTF